MKLLELFAGSRSVSRAAEKMGLETCSVDVEPLPGITLVRDIEFLQPDEIPFYPDIIWASIPCTTYSMAASKGGHRDENLAPLSDFAIKSDALARQTIKIIQAFPRALFYVENPRAGLRSQKFMDPLGNPVTIWWCRYGAEVAKPTDIWTNNLFDMFNQNGWRPRPECWNGNRGCHHQKAKRGSKTGTQGKKNAFERGKIPEIMAMEIIGASLNTLCERARSGDQLPWDETKIGGRTFITAPVSLFRP